MALALAAAWPDPAAAAAPDPATDAWTMTRASPFVTVNLRRATGLLALLPAATLGLLFAIRPRPYILLWVVAWLSASGMAFALSLGPDEMPIGIPAGWFEQVAAGRTTLVAWAACALMFGLAHRFSALWFRQPAAAPRWLMWTPPALVVWLGVAWRAPGPGAVFVPAFVAMSLWQAKGGLVYLRRARQYRFTGALLTGLGLLAIVAGNAVSAVIAMTQGGLTTASVALAYANLGWIGLMALGMHLLVFEDLIEELRTANAALARSRDDMRTMAVTDALTGCFNRRFLAEVAAHELEQHWRFGVPLSILFVDCDRFKLVNDTRGHDVGDRVLQAIGATLKATVRQSDFVFRWGGDEFLVLLSAGEEQARAKAGEIAGAFAASPVLRDLPPGVGLSIGCAAVPPGTTDLAPLIEQADRDMYARKTAREARG